MRVDVCIGTPSCSATRASCINAIDCVQREYCIRCVQRAGDGKRVTRRVGARSRAEAKQGHTRRCGWRTRPDLRCSLRLPTDSAWRARTQRQRAQLLRTASAPAHRLRSMPSSPSILPPRRSRRPAGMLQLMSALTSPTRRRRPRSHRWMCHLPPTTTLSTTPCTTSSSSGRPLPPRMLLSSTNATPSGRATLFSLLPSPHLSLPSRPRLPLRQPEQSPSRLSPLPPFLCSISTMSLPLLAALPPSSASLRFLESSHPSLLPPALSRTQTYICPLLSRFRPSRRLSPLIRPRRLLIYQTMA